MKPMLVEHAKAPKPWHGVDSHTPGGVIGNRDCASTGAACARRMKPVRSTSVRTDRHIPAPPLGQAWPLRASPRLAMGAITVDRSQPGALDSRGTGR